MENPKVYKSASNEIEGYTWIPIQSLRPINLLNPSRCISVNKTPNDVEKERRKKKAEELDNSVLFDVHTWSEYPQTNNAVDALLKEFNAGPKFKGRDNLKKTHIKVVILNLYVAWLIDPECYVAFYRRESEYRAKTRYNSLHISKKTIDVVDALLRNGYITQVKGKYGREEGYRSYMSRMRATKKLIDLIVDTHGITEEMVEVHRHRQCIHLRDYDEEKDKQVDIEYDDTPEINRMRDELYAYNNLLRRTFIDIPHFPERGVFSGKKRRATKIDRSKKFVRRIFIRDSWDTGGRFYGGWWQRLPSKWRERIRINDEPVVELDYSGLHIVMLYALEGIDYWKEIGTDPYQLGQGYEQSDRMRGLLKVILLTIINARTPQAAIKAVQKEVNFNPNELGWVKEEGLELKEIVERFQEYHKQISHRFSSGIGITLQNADSRMAELVIKEFTARGIPILCIHDSFVVQDKHEDDMWKVMEKAGGKIIEALSNKFELEVKIKKAQISERQEEIRGDNNEVTYINMGPRTHEKLAKAFGGEIDEEGNLVRTSPTQQVIDHSEIIYEQIYLDKLAEKPDPEYKRRWTAHQERVWEEVYYREED